MTRRQALIAGLASLVACSTRMETLAKAINLVFEGDSLTSDDIVLRNYPIQLAALLGENPVVRNFAVGGSTLAIEIPTREALVDQAFNADPSVMNVCCVWAGTNDLKQFETAPAQVMALYSAYLLRRRARGFKTVALTILPRYSPTTPASFEANRQAFNAALRADHSFADALADVAADPRIGDVGDQFDPLLYADKVHLTEAGYAIIASIVQTAIEGI